MEGKSANGVSEFDGIPPLDPQSWIARAFDYARARSQLPDSVTFWTLMSFCGAALQDRLFIGWSGKPIFPNLPLLVVGPSGIGKTSAINTIEPLFNRVLPVRVPEDSTAESIARYLAQNQARTPYNNSCGMWIVPELADVFGRKDYQQGMIARVTRLLDNPKDRAVDRKSLQSPIVIPGYCVLTWIAGSTMDWMQKHVDEAVTAGGFLPRLFVCDASGDLNFVPDPEVDDAVIQELNTELLQLLPQVQFGGAKRIYLQQYPEWVKLRKTIFEEYHAARNDPEGPFIARRAENTLRIWLIINGMQKCSIDVATISPIINEMQKVQHNAASMQHCAKLAQWFENQAVSVAKRLKCSNAAYPTPLQENTYRVLQSIKSNQVVTYHILCANLRMTSRDLYAALVDLRDQGLIKWNGAKGIQGTILQATSPLESASQEKEGGI